MFYSSSMTAARTDQEKAPVFTRTFIAWCATVFFMAQAMPFLGVILIIATALYLAVALTPPQQPDPDERTQP
jgi:hypothetical protein